MLNLMAAARFKKMGQGNKELESVTHKKHSEEQTVEQFQIFLSIKCET